MKKLCTISGVFVALFVFCSCAREVNIIPEPNHMEVRYGKFDLSDASFGFDGRTLDVGTRELIRHFAARLSEATGNRHEVLCENGKADIDFVLNPELGREEYHLDVNADGVKVHASDYNGFLYAIESVKQMLPPEFFACAKDSPKFKNRQTVDWTIPRVNIKDKPRFAYRGFMLDCCRHFFETDEVKKMIDVMALHKINTLHWHLTDDQGWRVEIKKYPKLTEVGAYRDGTMVGHYPSDPKDIVVDDIRYGGFYTQEQLKDVVDYARKRGITIIPEIDLPGHMVAALASYPELGCTGGPYEVRKIWDIAEEALCPGKESTFVFLENVFSELMDIFPSEYIHVGGDECMKNEWEKCPDCRKRIDELGLETDENHTKEQYLQNYVTARIQKFLNGHGRKLIGWDEILEGNLAEGATVMSWRGTEGGIEAAKRGYDVVMSPSSYVYFDHYQAKDKSLEPLAICCYLPIEKVYSYEPCDGIPEESQNHILGVQANLWTEYIAKPMHLEYMALPRMDALSEVQWCDPDNKDYKRFERSLMHMFEIYDFAGYTYCKEIMGRHGLPGIEGGTN